MPGERTSSTKLVRATATDTLGECSFGSQRELTAQQMEFRCGSCTFVVTTAAPQREVADYIRSREDRWIVMLVRDDGNTIGQVVD